MPLGNDPEVIPPLSQNPWLDVELCLNEPWNDQVTVVPWFTLDVDGEKKLSLTVTDDAPPTADGAPTSAANIRAAAPRPAGASRVRMRTSPP